MKPAIPRIVITSGEPAGIGPDLCLMLANKPHEQANITIIGDINLLQARADELNINVSLTPYQASPTPQAGAINVLHIPVKTPVQTGHLDANNSPYVLEMLSTAIKQCQDNTFDAMVTAPVHKGIINDAGIAFTGHTEYLAEQTKTPQVVMMLVGGGLKVALVTTHLPLSNVASTIDQTLLEKTIRILHADMMNQFNVSDPRILVAGLNPHAGESGYLGDEEITIITPVLDKLRNEGMQLKGPLPADTLFTPNHLKEADCVLAMYHDQGLATLKYASFGEGVNVTLGLPIIRTSVDHGTALDLAGTGNIHTGSMQAAVNLAVTLAHNKRQPKQ